MAVWRVGSTLGEKISHTQGCALRSDRPRDFAGYVSNWEKWTMNVIAWVLHAATRSTAWLQKPRQKQKRELKRKLERKPQAIKQAKKQAKPAVKPAAKISNVVNSAERGWFEFLTAGFLFYQVRRTWSSVWAGQSTRQKHEGHKGCENEGYSTIGKSRTDWNMQSKEGFNSICLDASQSLWAQRKSHGHRLQEPPQGLASSACPNQVCLAKWDIATQISKNIFLFTANFCRNSQAKIAATWGSGINFLSMIW